MQLMMSEVNLALLPVLVVVLSLAFVALGLWAVNH